jgi:hypothetical protein
VSVSKAAVNAVSVSKAAVNAVSVSKAAVNAASVDEAFAPRIISLIRVSNMLILAWFDGGYH